jgi:cysteinyl-tRNA synthetase
MLKLFNTETRQKEPIHPLGDKIKMYTCGPTVYDFAHIGNFRTYVVEDVLRRAIQYFGMAIEQAMNLTDIDDKTIRGAIEKNIPLLAYTKPFKEAFFEDLQALNIQRVEYYPAASDHIGDMIRMIEKLMQTGHAYQAKSGSIYFSIAQFAQYGRLTQLNLDELKVNASGDNENDEYDKDNVSDFVLWKAFDPARDGQIFWESPFGKGRPGWHIECSAMAQKLLGETIDIHCGGVDNMFPHHENEIAQSECCSGKHFVRYWLHVEHLLVDHKKMSPSLGNFYTLRDLLQKGYRPQEVRYLLLSIHYRMQLNFTMAGLDAARSSLKRIEDLVFRLRAIRTDQAATATLENADLKFQAALADDLNLSAVLAALFDLVRDLNTLCDAGKLGKEEARSALELLSQWDQVLAVLPLAPKEETIPDELIQLLAKREQARKDKNWKLSDELRESIDAKGYYLEDTPQGSRLKKK